MEVILVFNVFQEIRILGQNVKHAIDWLELIQLSGLIWILFYLPLNNVLDADFKCCLSLLVKLMDFILFFKDLKVPDRRQFDFLLNNVAALIFKSELD